GAFLALLPSCFSEAMHQARQSPRFDDPPKPASVGDTPLRHAVEIRNDSFLQEQFIDQLREHRVALVVADTAGKWPVVEELTAELMYLRLHGDKELYASGYDEQALSRWEERIRSWRSGRQPADARRISTKTDSSRRGRDLYCYFDNDIKVRAPFDARRLLEKLGPAGTARPAARGVSVTAHQSPERHLTNTAPTVDAVRVLTINTHKGFSFLNRRFILPELRDAVRTLSSDVVFLQEVLGTHHRHGERYDNWPDAPHYEFLADTMWPDFAYGRNAVYPDGHHGNALLSKFPILHYENLDVSITGTEERGLLHTILDVPGQLDLHAICVHLGLREGHRREQLLLLCRLLDQL